MLEEEENLIVYDEIEEEDSLYEHYTLVAAKGQNQMRVDKFLANLLPNISRSKIQNAAEIGAVKVNELPVKVSYKVKPLDRVQLMLPYPPAAELVGEDLPLEIVYEDDQLIVVNKEAMMVVHPSVGHRTGTLIHALLWHIEQLPEPQRPQDNPRPGLVHRIDRGTSGILLVAKTEFALAHLGKQFFDRTTDRHYHAVVWGNVEKDEGTIIGNIARSPKDRKIFMVYDDPEIGKHAVTHYKVLERFGVATLIQCKLETGRTHQIRVHMKHIGHPLVGDFFYEGDKLQANHQTQKLRQFANNCLEIISRQALHAKTLAFTHPTSKERLAFDSEWPEDFRLLVEKMRRFQH